MEEGSEEESGWARSSTSRPLTTTPFVASTTSYHHHRRRHQTLPIHQPAAGTSSHNVSSASGNPNKREEDDYNGEEDRERLPFWNKKGNSSLRGRNPNPNNGGAAAAAASAEQRGDISLREWLDRPERTVDVVECLHIFRQIVEMVSLAHDQGVGVNNVRPSCFVMSNFNRVSFIESASCSTSGSDSCEDASSSDGHGGGGFDLESDDPAGAFEGSAQRLSSLEEVEGRKGEEDSGGMGRDGGGGGGERNRTFPLKHILVMEYTWYTSPEEATGGASSFASDVYRLGVLLFELFCTFSSLEEKFRTMSNLRHRVLPPQLLLKCPKEASFCLWLLHPQPSNRPKMNEVLKSDFLNEPRDSLDEHEAAIKLREELEDQDLLLEFLLQMQQRKQESADKLHDTICFLSSDIEEVVKQQSVFKKNAGSFLELDKDEHSVLEREEPLFYPERTEDSASTGSRKRFRQGHHNYNEEESNEHLAEGSRSEPQAKRESILSKSSRLMKNFKKLESAYFLTRCRMNKPVSRVQSRTLPVSSIGRGSVVRTEGSSVDNLLPRVTQSGGRKSEWMNPFLEGLCKYLSYSKLNVRADLKQGDFLSSSNLVCSLGFDRDKELFATAGVNRKIKIFECDAIINEDRDIHYPVVEMASRSKLSSICWNSYIKSQIASSDFEGVVQVWDVTRSQVFVEMREHERRVWSVDFSLSDPTKLASGSDDGTVKLWNINQAGSIGTIKTKANVCSVQFPPDSSRSLAIGSADHRVYCYDLRNLRLPWCTLVGHAKTVSYVKFVDSSTLVSASTDNTLKLWDLSVSTSRVLDNPLQTFTGHTNVKNFVGLSISDGYIATGSETNEVFVYHKAFPMPVLSFKFNSADPISGAEVDDASQFISCVCWRGQTSTLVAANSSGNIKLLEMV